MACAPCSRPHPPPAPLNPALPVRSGAPAYARGIIRCLARAPRRPFALLGMMFGGSPACGIGGLRSLLYLYCSHFADDGAGLPLAPFFYTLPAAAAPGVASQFVFLQK